MGNTSRTFTWDTFLTSTTGTWLDKQPKDQLFKQRSALQYLTKNCLHNQTGGEVVQFPVLKQANNTVKFMGKYDELDMTAQDPVTKAWFSFVTMAASIVYSIDKELDPNKGDSKIFDIVEAKTNQALQSLLASANDLLCGSRGTDTTKFFGLFDLIGKATGTVGGIARASESWWVPNVNSTGGSLSASGPLYLHSMINLCTTHDGSDVPDALLTDPATTTKYAKVSIAKWGTLMRSNKVGDLGFGELTFEGIPLLTDSQMSAGYMYFLNKKYLRLYVMTSSQGTTKDIFKVRPFQESAKQLAMSSKLYSVIASCVTQPRAMGVIYTITQ